MKPDTEIMETDGVVEGALEFVIRRALMDDLRVMAELIGELFAIESDFKVDFEKQFSGLQLLNAQAESDIFVARYKNRPVGMVTMQRVISSAEGGYAGLVEDVVVSQGFRGMGIGKGLIDHVVMIAQERGYVRLQLAADQNNTPALAFYDSYGFHRTHLVNYHLTAL